RGCRAPRDLPSFPTRRSSDLRWHVRGLPGQDTGRDPFAALERLGERQVIGGSLTVDAPALGLHATVPRIDVRLRVDGRDVRAASRAWMDPDAAPLRAAARFDRERGDGQFYAGMEEGELDGWSPLLRMAGIAVEDGQGRAEVWAGVRDSRIDSVTARVDLEDVGLRGTGGGDGGPRRAVFDSVAGGIEWARAEDGWRVDVPELTVGASGAEWRSQGVAVQAGGRYALVAERIELAPVVQVLALSDEIASGMRDWLSRADAN